jgi:ATP-dependent Lhr-like helicase
MTSSPISGSDPPTESTSAGFARLHPSMQRWVHEQGWTTLHDAQEQAIGPILVGDRDVVIAAATAAGKTEAAFLPICSSLAATADSASAAADTDPWGRHDPWADATEPVATGVDVLYVSPLKALINDQYDRLELLCEQAGVAVHRWHGDVASSFKHKVLRDPGGVLLITPESLEALFVNRGSQVSRVLGGLRYVVIDELHSFLGTPRGAQLQALLARVEIAIRRRPPRIGLSATLGDMTAAASFLRPADPQAVLLIESSAVGQEIQLQIRGYRAISPDLPRAEAAAAEAAGSDVDLERTLDGDKIAIADHLFQILRGSDNLVFANSRRDVELYADLLARRAEQLRVPNEFWPHHGNLAKDVREVVESQLKDRSRPVTAVCTSTLELGIDIGSVASVAQIGPPPSVAALRQRLGRSGRRDEPAVLRLYVSEPQLDVRSSPIDQLRCDLVQSIAMVRLLLDRWLEPPEAAGLNLSTLIQQTLSLIAQHGGISPVEAHRVLCGPGPFERVDSRMYVRLLRALASADLLVQAGDGTLLHGQVGERFVNHYSFYAAFQTPEEWRLIADGRTLGSLPVDQAITIGGLLLFAGRRWRITGVDPSGHVIELTRAAGGVPPIFGGRGAAVSDRVRAEMVVVYEGTDTPAYIDGSGRELLAQARDAWSRLGPTAKGVLDWGTDTLLLPWVGDATLATISLALRTGGFDVDTEGPAVLIREASSDTVLAKLRELCAGAPPTGTDLARMVENQAVEKWDWALDSDLSAEAYAARSLDPEQAWTTLRRLLEGSSERAALPAAPTAGARLDATGGHRRARPGNPVEFCVVDVETTGFSPRLGDRVIEVATVRMTAGGTVLDEWATLVNPVRDIGPTSVHGISAGECLDAPMFGEIAGDVLDRLDGAVVAAHNHRFDWGFLVAEYGRAGHVLPSLPGLCTIALGLRVQPAMASRRLAACCDEFGIPLPRAHTALDDARATAQLLAAYVHLACPGGDTRLEALGCDPTTWPASLPDLPASGRRHPRGDRRRTDDQGNYLRGLVARLDGHDATDALVAGYLELLDRVLEDRRLTTVEADELASTAASWGLGVAAVDAAHRRYFAGLADVALADGVLTDAERNDLDLVRRLLQLEPAELDRALEISRRRTELSIDRDNALTGLSVCFTGALRCTLDGRAITRAIAERLAANAGLKVRGDVAKGLDLLVVADPDTQSGKARRAQKLGTRIIAEPVFWSHIGAHVQ